MGGRARVGSPATCAIAASRPQFGNFPRRRSTRVTSRAKEAARRPSATRGGTFMFLRRRYDAVEAAAMGLVHEVVADGGLEGFVGSL